jgi:GNAT superfamily N-acetyltransferase
LVALMRNMPIASEDLNALRAASWEGVQTRDWEPVLARSMGWVCATDGERLVGFVNAAWDGGAHAFLLDTSVHRDYQRRRIGTALVRGGHRPRPRWRRGVAPRRLRGRPRAVLPRRPSQDISDRSVLFAPARLTVPVGLITLERPALDVSGEECELDTGDSRLGATLIGGGLAHQVPLHVPQIPEERLWRDKPCRK